MNEICKSSNLQGNQERHDVIEQIPLQAVKAATWGDEGEDDTRGEAGEEVADGAPVGAPQPVLVEGATLLPRRRQRGRGPGGDGK